MDEEQLEAFEQAIATWRFCGVTNCVHFQCFVVLLVKEVRDSWQRIEALEDDARYPEG